MRQVMMLAAAAAILAGCESTPRSTAAPGTPTVHALRGASAVCADKGLTPGSAEMVACMREAEAVPAP